MHNVKTVIFDVGRVLVRLDASGEKFGDLMRAIGIPPEKAFEKFWYAHEVRQLMTGEVGAQEFHQMVVNRFGIDFSFDRFREAWCDLFHPMPGMREVFLRLAGRYRMGLLSDTDPMHWERMRGMIPWTSVVDKPTLSYEVGYLKPHPNMFEAAAASCGSAMEHCLFIDDLIENVDGSRYCGMPALQFHDTEKLVKDLSGLHIL